MGVGKENQEYERRTWSTGEENYEYRRGEPGVGEENAGEPGV